MSAALRKVCAAINFNPESNAVIGSAATLATSFGVCVDLLSVVRPAALYRHVLVPPTFASINEVVRRVRGRLEKVRVSSDLAAIVPVECHVRVGYPFSELVAGAIEGGAGLLIVGNRVPGRIAQAIVTTTVQRILRMAPLPVLVVRSALPEAPRTILAATDFSADSSRAMEQAVALACAWRARLVLLHVLEPIAEPYLWPTDEPPDDMYLAEPEQMDAEWDAVLAGFDMKGVEWEKRTVKGLATERIVAAVGEVKPDLLVVGTAGHGGIAHFFLGSVAENLLRELSCPVLCVRNAAEVFLAARD